MTYPFECKKLTTWFEENQRDLPWRQDRTPYAVWVSEIMLQQTQVATVIPYFERWMERFPNIQALAAAPLEEVIKLWEGLGYYSRARRLHAGAKEVLEKHSGQIPHTSEKLYSIKGLGPYTVGAIQSFAFQKKAVAVDGNVIRVLSRYFNISEDVSKSSTQKKLREIAEAILPNEKHWLFNEGLIELGATICQPKPKCSKCPIKNKCQSFRLQNQASLPFKPNRTATIPLYRAVAIIKSQGHYLIKQVEEGKVMSGLHEFPYMELKENETHDLQILKKLQSFPLPLSFIRSLPKETHTFTKYRATLFPALFETKTLEEVEGYEWVESTKLGERPFSSGHRRLLTALKNNLIIVN